MKLNIIQGKKGCKEIEIEVDYNNINGITKDKEIRTLYMTNKSKYRLTLESYKKLIKELKRKLIYNKLGV